MEHAFRLASRLGIRWPILQAPAGGPVGAALAVAVSEAGALGAFPLTWAAPGTAEALIAEVRHLVAAGEIGDGREVARALSLGASGAMLGTRFVATQESLAHEEYQRRILEAEACEAVLTICFDQGWPQAAHRVLVNSTFHRWEEAGCPPPGRRPGPGKGNG